MKKLFLFLIQTYKMFFSALLRILFSGGCRFSPTCSDYAQKVVEKFGAVKGTALALKRIGRCHPFSKGGYDPVPLQ
jgi:putative membrane protein insertion efficiency factor